ncbi:MAG: hypothetical protein B1H09_02660 [Gemmatimonadaceae bacterium 4484_173]|nr:MAG: hypothetical protein B1H09_02660 [Gemmatimonadaceae bacterium 4484_173]RKZ05053.1 MAG: hypothetical protein DRQ21_00840 [Candidatus Fermentibacteria bacterium]
MKRTSMILATALVAFLLFPAIAEASFAKTGTSGAQFLKIGVGCRGVAMGGAFIATADDPSAAYWNPGALVRVPGTQFQFSGTQLYADMLYGNGIITHELAGIGTMALQFGLLSSGDMNLTTVEDPSGTETFTCSDMVVGLSFARMLTDRFSTGLTAKYVRETWDDVSAGGIAIDLGTLYDTGFKTLRIGMSIQNFGPELTPDGEAQTWNSGSDSTVAYSSYAMPMNFRIGLAMDVVDQGPHQITVEVDGVHPADNVEQVNIGAEYWYNNMIALRGGYRVNTDEEGLTAGAGFRVPLGEKALSLDYAYQDFNRLEMVHRASLGFAF